MAPKITQQLPAVDYLPFLRTLRLLPAHVVLDMATRELEPIQANACVCGWALRLAFQNGVPAESLAAYAGKLDDVLSIEDERRAVDGGRAVVAQAFEIPGAMADAFGGTRKQWAELYHGAAGEPDGRYSKLLDEMMDEGTSWDQCRAELAAAVELAFVIRVEQCSSPRRGSVSKQTR